MLVTAWMTMILRLSTSQYLHGTISGALKFTLRDYIGWVTGENQLGLVFSPSLGVSNNETSFTDT